MNHHPKYRVIHGDALRVLLTIASNSIDAVITDPPYARTESGEMAGQVSSNFHLSETHGRGYAANCPIAYRKFCDCWLAEVERVLKPGGHLVAFGGNRTQHHIASAAEAAGLSIREHLVWSHGHGAPRGLKLRDSSGVFTGMATTIRPLHESATLARKTLEGTVAQNVAKWGTGALNIDPCRVGPKSHWPGNVFVTPKPSRSERIEVGGVRHPTVKPLELMRWLVRLVTPEGGLVLDPFAGSGTTAEAAILEGRRIIAIEKEAIYVPLIHARIRRAQLRG